MLARRLDFLYICFFNLPHHLSFFECNKNRGSILVICNHHVFSFSFTILLLFTYYNSQHSLYIFITVLLKLKIKRRRHNTVLVCHVCSWCEDDCCDVDAPYLLAGEEAEVILSSFISSFACEHTLFVCQLIAVYAGLATK